MPTYEVLPEFWRDWARLTDSQRQGFQASFRTGLRVKGVRGAPGVFELTWAADGRATFSYGPAAAGEPHLIWRRIGTHEILRTP